MKFETYPEPFVSGDVSSVTLWRWCQEGCPYHLMRNGRRMYRLSEVEEWMFGSVQEDVRFKRTSNTGEGAA
jgi:predicted site-specific integrase-resolvase